MKKVHWHKTPYEGWGVGYEGAYSKYFITVFTMIEVDSNGPYRSGSKVLQVLEKDKIKHGALEGLWTT